MTNFFTPVHGGWGDWVEVGACSVTCGGGKQKKVRSCDKPEPQYGGDVCQGSSTMEHDCNSVECPPGKTND